MAVDVSDLYAAVQARAAEVADVAASIVVTMVKADAPVSAPTPTNTHSGQLRDSLDVIETFSDGAVETRVVGTDPASPASAYAQFTDEVDTAAHPIEPVNARHLRFWWDRGPAGPNIYFMAHVNHPGTHGQRWFASQNPARWQSALQSAAVS